jgi:hypothetical protein
MKAPKPTHEEKPPKQPKRPTYPAEVQEFVDGLLQDEGVPDRMGIVSRLAVLWADSEPWDKVTTHAWLRAHGVPESFIP